MDLQNYTRESAVIPQLKCATLVEAVTTLVDRLAEAGVVKSASELVAEVMRREEEGSTVVGGGLVVPHARCRGLDEVHIALTTLDPPLELEAEDGEPVDIVMLLVGPERDPRQMLRVLARLARLVKDRAFLDRIREAGTASDLLAVFGEASDS